MKKYSIKRRTRKYVYGYGFLSIARTFSNKYKKQLLDTGLNALKICPKKAVHKAAEAISEFIRYNVAEKIIPPEKKRRNIKRILNYSLLKL